MGKRKGNAQKSDKRREGGKGDQITKRGTFHGINKAKNKRNDMKYKNFIGNKYDGQGFADKRKTKVMHEFQKVMRKERQKSSSDKVRQIYHEETERNSGDEAEPKRSKKKLKMSAYKKAEMVWKQKEEEREKQRLEFEEGQKQKAAALAKYKEKKKAAYKKLSVKNYKGQPNMASQMDLLLGKLTKSGV